MKVSKMVDLSTAARILGISRQAVAQHGERGHFKVVCAGAARLIHTDEIERMLLRGLDSTEHERKQARRVVQGLHRLYRDRDAQVSAVMAGYRPALDQPLTKEERRNFLGGRKQRVAGINGEFDKAIAVLERARATTFGR